jgi:predicted metal-dependent phosphoesterase TrpH
MPRGDPFTALCRQSARLARPVVADLHLHTTASDGEFTPSQVAAFARQARLDAIAITDHDTLAGVGDAVAAAGQGGVRVIPGVELTADWHGREVHVLGYFSGGLPPDSGERGIQTRLTEMCRRRRERFRDFVRLIRESGQPLDDGLVTAVETVTVSLGRRHVASLLVRTGIARNRREAWGRFVGLLGPRVVPKLRLSFAEACELIRESGGVSCLAHPPADFTEPDVASMTASGLMGLEVKFPAAGAGRTAELKAWATRLGLVVTGGSDCHGPDGRWIGSVGVSADEYERFRHPH